MYTQAIVDGMCNRKRARVRVSSFSCYGWARFFSGRGCHTVQEGVQSGRTRRLETLGVRHCVGDGGLAKAAVVQELEARVTRDVMVAEGGLKGHGGGGHRHRVAYVSEQ